MIVSPSHRQTCLICRASRYPSRFGTLPTGAPDPVCKPCRSDENAGKQLPRALQRHGDLNRAAIIGPSARARMQQSQVYRANRRPLPPGLTSSRASAIAQWLNDQGAPVKMTCRDVWYALRGAKTVRDVWPACPEHLALG